MSWVPWFVILTPIVLLVFLGIFGPNDVKGKKWRGHKEPSAMLGPDRPEPPDSRRN